MIFCIFILFEYLFCFFVVTYRIKKAGVGQVDKIEKQNLSSSIFLKKTSVLKVDFYQQLKKVKILIYKAKDKYWRTVVYAIDYLY